eukprot:CAMPEP_0196742318 /NCGR_PEP_ID=MMETSP1091-20130531/45950_1 /TAXON_ID=302021 /ORGANISM="Rhodomonas sp., Strain CCMP768" /LENGTH=159 /DNA_ID=CAMNT_0042088321 /DNA_START=101 /DNA_END=580 /DNA_ORIENTATION=-
MSVGKQFQTTITIPARCVQLLALVAILSGFPVPAHAASRAFSRLITGRIAPSMNPPGSSFQDKTFAPELFYGQSRAWDFPQTIEDLGRAGKAETSDSDSRRPSLATHTPRSGSQPEPSRTLSRSLSFADSLHRSHDLGMVFTRARALRYVQREVDPRLL